MVQRARKRTLSQRRPTPDDEFLILRQTLHAPYWIRGAHKAVAVCSLADRPIGSAHLESNQTCRLNRFAGCDAPYKRNKERGWLQ